MRLSVSKVRIMVCLLFISECRGLMAGALPVPAMALSISPALDAGLPKPNFLMNCPSGPSRNMLAEWFTA